MPFKGIICDDKKAKGQKFSFEECLACARNRGPRKCDSSYQVIKAISQNNEDRKDAGFSTTMVTQFCPRKVILQQEEDYWEAPSKVYARVRGTVHHLFVEQFSQGLEPYVAEIRFKKKVVVDGVEFVLTGKPDLVLPEDKLIIDFKSVGDTQSEWKPIKSRRAQSEHIEQVNIYAWLLWGGEATEDDHSGQDLIKTGDIVHYEIREGGIQYMDMSIQMKVSVPIWTIEQTEAFIIEKLRPHVHYKNTGELPPIITNLFGERHTFCNFCPLKEACDRRAEEAGELAAA